MAFSKLFKNWRLIILMIALVSSIWLINPQFNSEGVAIKSVMLNGPAFLAGMSSPSNIAPTNLEKVLEINNIKIDSIKQFHEIEDNLLNSSKTLIKTNLNTYVLKNTSSELGFSVIEAPTNDIRKGLDLQGGTKIVLRPVGEFSIEDLNLAVESITQRLNLYGLSDVSVRKSRDLEGSMFILVEIADLNVEKIVELITSQGKFEARIGNVTVFEGGKDITYVCKTPDCSRVEGCQPDIESGVSCRFSFGISLSPSAAEKQAGATKNLDIVIESGQQYLSESLELYLDDELVDSLRISSGLKGRAETEISISGPGSGASRSDAEENARENMKELQTVLVTGSLPVVLEVVYAKPISPILGEEFSKNSIKIAFFALLIVMLVVFIRYQDWKVSLPMFILLISEIIILFGVAAGIGWNIDLAAIAGVIIAIGTALDHAIIIADETLQKTKESFSWKQKLKRAFFIIFGSYFTIFVAMIPLWAAGAGLLRGFAFTTILGFSIGVLITRPAYAIILEHLIEK